MLIQYTQEELDELQKIRDSYKDRISLARDKNERAIMRMNLGTEMEAFADVCARKRVEAMGEDLDLILADAEDQVERLPRYIFQLLVGGMTKDDLNLMGVFTEIDGKHYLKSSYLAYSLRDEIRFHIEALSKDNEKLQRLYDRIDKIASTSEYSDHEDISVSHKEKAFFETLKFRRNPLPDVDKFWFENDKVNSFILHDNGTSQEINGQLAILWRVPKNNLSEKKQEVPVYIGLSYEGTESMIAKKMTAYDRAVYDAVGTIFYYWRLENPSGPLLVSPQDVWRVMNGKPNGDTHNPSEAQLKKICGSIDKMRFTHTYMDISEEIKAFNYTVDDERIVKGRIDTYLLKGDKVTFYTEKGRQIIGYRVDDEPILFTYNSITDHLVSVPFELLDTSSDIPDGENVVEFKSYLIRQIKYIMKDKRRKNIILLESIYAETDIPTPEERAEKSSFTSERAKDAYIRKTRAADIKKLEGILKAWVTKGWIKDAVTINKDNEPVREKQRPKGFMITV